MTKKQSLKKIIAQQDKELLELYTMVLHQAMTIKQYIEKYGELPCNKTKSNSYW